MNPNPLRIALLSEHASPLATPGGGEAGGPNIYAAHVACALAARGHRVDVLTRRDDPIAADVVHLRRGVRVLHVKAGPPHAISPQALLPHTRAFAAGASELLASGPRYDVLHANGALSGVVGLTLRKQFGVPLVTTLHGLGLAQHEHEGDENESDGERLPSERIAIEQRVVRDADCIVAETPQDEDDLLRLYGAPRQRVVGVPCGVDLDIFYPGERFAARQRLGIDASEFTLLHLGRLVARKGIEDVVRAMALLSRDRPARLVVVGGASMAPDETLTPEIGRLRQLARELDVADRVRFVGRRDHRALRDWYVAADVFVTTPWHEPFGIAPLEAMACGTPVVASAVGGLRHTVVDNATGYLVPPKDPEALARALRQLQANPSLGAALGRGGVRRVRSMFTWDQVAQQLERIYLELLHDRPAPHAAATAFGTPVIRASVAPAH